MLSARVIPCLDVKDGRVVKGINFVDLIDAGDPVVIFPDSVKQKDINEMVLAGHNVQDLVESNTYQGLQAKLKLSQWKKV